MDALNMVIKIIYSYSMKFYYVNVKTFLIVFYFHYFKFHLYTLNNKILDNNQKRAIFLLSVYTLQCTLCRIPQ